jgi:hypothetical protein
VSEFYIGDEDGEEFAITGDTAVFGAWRFEHCAKAMKRWREGTVLLHLAGEVQTIFATLENT